MVKLFIGMPVYNGEKYIKNALDSLVCQTFTDWEMLISDNASEDDTPLICKEYCDKDKRIKYVRQSTNIGYLNFRYLLENSESEYFMWAAADDEWDSAFIEACLKCLESSENVGLAFTNIVNIDSFGMALRERPSFKKFSHPDRQLSIINFVLDPECFGKSNLVYGIYRIKKLKAFLIDFISNVDSTNYYAPDIALNLGVLCRVRLSIDERVLFRKRIIKPSENKKNHVFPQFQILKSFTFNGKNNFDLYKKAILAASAGTKYEELVFTLMEYREKLVKEVQAYNFRANRSNLFKSVLKTVLPNSLINFIKKRRK